MSYLRKPAVAAVAVLMTLGSMAGSTFAEEAPPEPIYVCTFDQVLPGFGFVPVTFSPEVYALLGGDPDDCQTEVPVF